MKAKYITRVVRKNLTFSDWEFETEAEAKHKLLKFLLSKEEGIINITAGRYEGGQYEPFYVLPFKGGEPMWHFRADEIVAFDPQHSVTGRVLLYKIRTVIPTENIAFIIAVDLNGEPLFDGEVQTVLLNTLLPVRGQRERRKNMNEKIPIDVRFIKEYQRKAAERELIENGIPADKTGAVLRRIGYLMLDTDLYPEIPKEGWDA